MVRGQPGCPSLCPTCKQDCICSCGSCHWCYSRQYIDSEHVAHACAGGLEGIGASSLMSNIINLSTLSTSEVYSVKVGKKTSMTFNIYKDALASSSRYFKALFDFDSAKEKDEVVLDTEVDDPNAFRCFIQYAYMKDYFCPNAADGEDLLLHAAVYVLAERLEAMDLKDLALKKATLTCVNLSAILSKRMNLRKENSEDSVAQWSLWAPAHQNSARAIRKIPDIVRMIYQNTPSPPTDSQTLAGVSEEKMEGSAEQGEPDALEAINLCAAISSHDRFRALLSRFSASCLNELRNSTTFGECLRDVPEFAQDLMGHLVQATALELDAYGNLKAA